MKPERKIKAVTGADSFKAEHRKIVGLPVASRINDSTHIFSSPNVVFSGRTTL